MTLPIIFRADRKDRTITAVFPSLAGTSAPDTFLVYQHVGQHGAGSLSWYYTTRAATPGEYAALLAELQRIYAPDTLQVVSRMTRQHAAIRQGRA